MAAWSAKLVSEVKISENDSLKLGTKIASDVRFLPRDAKAEIAAASPISVRERLQELHAFQGWMDTVANSKVSPFIIRAQSLRKTISVLFIFRSPVSEYSLRAFQSDQSPSSVQNSSVMTAFGRFETPSHMQTGLTAAIILESHIGRGRAPI